MNKTISFLIFFVSIANLCNAQSYHRLLPADTVTWQHFNCMIGVKPAGEIETQNSAIYVFDRPVSVIDTVSINGFVYKKAYELSFYNLSYANKQFLGFMREDTSARKVYFRETASSPESLLYDFSLSVNDSVFLNFFSSTSYNGYYKVDSIVVKNIKAGPRKHFYMRKHVNNNDPANKYFIFIESVGCNMHVLYPFAGFWDFCHFNWGSSCKHHWNLGVSCKHDQNLKKYQSCTITQAYQSSCIAVTDSCNYRNICGGLKHFQLSGCSVYPNPASEKIIISFESSREDPVTVEIYDLPGKLIRKKSFLIERSERIEVPVNDLENGLYILKIGSGNNFFSQEISISH